MTACKACGGTGRSSTGGQCVACVRRAEDQAIAGSAPAPMLVARVDTVESGCPWIADESVDLAIFSPPYFEKDGANLAMFRALGTLLRRVLKVGGRAFCNIGQVSEDYDRVFEARAAILAGAEIGQGEHLHGWQTIAWVKSFAAPGEATMGHYTPVSASDHIMYSGHELVYQFVKGPPRQASRLAKLAIGVPYADPSNLKRGTRGKNGDLHDPGDTWFIGYETTGAQEKKAHRHAYPPELVRRIVKLVSPPAGSVILDPFIGGGTTAEVARAFGYRCIAVDRDPECIAALTGATLPAPEVVTRPFTPTPTEAAPRRRMSKSLAALIARGDDGSADPVAAEGWAPHPDDTLVPPCYVDDEPEGPGDDPTNPPPIPGKMCGTPGCANPQLHRTHDGDLCANGHGNFTGRPVRKKAKRAPAPQPDETDAANGAGYDPPPRSAKKKALIKKKMARR